MAQIFKFIFIFALLLSVSYTAPLNTTVGTPASNAARANSFSDYACSASCFISGSGTNGQCLGTGGIHTSVSCGAGMVCHCG